MIMKYLPTFKAFPLLNFWSGSSLFLNVYTDKTIQRKINSIAKTKKKKSFFPKNFFCLEFLFAVSRYVFIHLSSKVGTANKQNGRGFNLLFEWYSTTVQVIKRWQLNSVFIG